MENLLSVIIPLYNIEKYLAQCIQSVINQTYKFLEIILVDDGSTDSSGEICDKYALVDKRIKVIHIKNGGPVAARKVGLMHATGYFTTFVDGDDWIEPDMYSYLIAELKKNDVEVVTSGFIKECKDSSSTVYDGLDEGIYLKQSGILCRNLIYIDSFTSNGITTSLWNKVFLTRFIQKYFNTIDTNLCYGEDAACVYSYLPYAESVQVVHKAFYHYRFREDSIMHVHNERILLQLGLLYLHLLSYFQDHDYSKELKRQLSIFIMQETFKGLNYFMGISEDIKIPLYVLPSKVFHNGKRIVLYGAGMVGQAYQKLLSVSEELELVLWVDKIAKHYQEQGFPVEKIENILDTEYDVILLAISDAEMAETIRKDLIGLGISEHKIIWEEPKHILEQYVKLKVT